MIYGVADKVFWPGGSRGDEVGEEAVEGGVEVGAEAGMGAGGTKGGATHGGEPAETFVGLQFAYGSGATGGASLEGFHLAAQRVDVGTGSEGAQALFLYGETCPQPSTALAHHHQTYVDTLAALYAGYEAYEGVLIQYFVVRRLHGR